MYVEDIKNDFYEFLAGKVLKTKKHPPSEELQLHFHTFPEDLLNRKLRHRRYMLL